jgi:hypothetical protein
MEHGAGAGLVGIMRTCLTGKCGVIPVQCRYNTDDGFDENDTTAQSTAQHCMYSSFFPTITVVPMLGPVGALELTWHDNFV